MLGARRATRSRGVDATRIAAIGITNQRETTLLWERADGPARRATPSSGRTAAPRRCAPSSRRRGTSRWCASGPAWCSIPYFSATKIRWLLDNVTGLRARAEAGAIAFGTVDSFLIWRLSGGRDARDRRHNASRTLLLDLRDAALLRRALRAVRRAARACCPRCARRRGGSRETRGVPGLPDGIPIAGVAGDQQAALFGQDCTDPGDAKCTYRDRARSC